MSLGTEPPEVRGEWLHRSAARQAALTSRLTLLLERVVRLHRGAAPEVRAEALRLVPWLFDGVRGEFLPDLPPPRAQSLSFECAPGHVLFLRGAALDDPQERRLAAIFADQVRLAHDLALARDILRRESRHDPLTGLMNLRALEADAPSFEGEGYHLAVIDVDGLKALNDTQGHLAGDELLRRFAQKFQACSPSVYRTGGDEFVLLARAEQVAPTSAQLAPLRCSVGWAEIGSDWRAAYRLADARMYRVKAEHKGGGVTL